MTLTIPASQEVQRRFTASIMGIGVAAPPAMSQQRTLEVVSGMGCRSEQQRAWLTRIFLNSGINTRGSVLSADVDEFYPRAAGPEDRGPSTARRMERYAREAPELARRAAALAMQDCGISPAQITHLITTSCTGFFAPGLDCELLESLGLPRGVQRLHLGFMGCHAAFNALAAAREAAAIPDANVLVCCVELCTLHLAYGNDPGKLIANCLFADGAAAAVVGSGGNGHGDGRGWRLRDFSSYLVPGCRDAMTWKIADHGFEMTLSRGVPALIRRHLGGWCRNWLEKNGLEISDIAGWAIHPGGPKILTAVRDALRIGSHDLRFSQAVLAKHGNMSSATVMFILQQMASEVAGPCVAIGLGPGLMIEGMLLQR